MGVDELARRLAEILTRSRGAPVEIRSLTQLTGGAAKQTFSFTAVCGGRDERLILQLCSRPAAIVSQLTPRLTADADAHLMQAAAAAGIQAPHVVAILDPADGLGNGFITRFIEAEALGRRIVHDAAFSAARARLTAQCAQNLAAIHRLPVRGHPYLQPYPAAAQIDAYTRLVDHYGARTPELAYGLAWSRRHAPQNRPLCVVHGDFRMGNLLTDQQGLRCVLDWEVAHLGDPMQDLGWLCLRTWRFGGRAPVAGVGQREELFSAYENAGGSVDRVAVHFWEAWGNIKWAVMAMRKALRFRDGGQPSLEECAIGRRMEEPLWDFLQVLEQGIA